MKGRENDTARFAEIIFKGWFSVKFEDSSRCLSIHEELFTSYFMPYSYNSDIITDFPSTFEKTFTKEIHLCLMLDCIRQAKCVNFICCRFSWQFKGIYSKTGCEITNKGNNRRKRTILYFVRYPAHVRQVSRQIQPVVIGIIYVIILIM